MTNLLNKSNHPVEVKRVKVKIWTLRSEIEAAIADKLDKSDESELQNLDISEIQAFYHNHIPTEVDSEIAQESSDGDSTELAKIADEVLTDIDETKIVAAEDDNNESPPSFVRSVPKANMVFNGELLLADLHMDQVILFTDRKFLQGQNIIIQFLITSPFVISGEVKQVVNFARNSKIIKEIKLDHRIQINCSLLFPNERSNLRDFLQSVEPDIPVPPKKLKSKSDDNDDDDDDFDDLGL